MYRLILLCLLILVCVACGEAQNIRATNEAIEQGKHNDSLPLTDDIDVFDVQDGDCIRSSIAEGESVYSLEITVCSGDWEYKVLSHFNVSSSGTLPNDTYFDQQADEHCDSRYTFFLYPTRESWAQGDRRVDCLVAREFWTAP